jgi:hypothetical protein
MCTLVAAFDVAAERSRPACFNRPHDAQVRQRQTITGPVSRTVLSKDVGQRQARP